MSIILWQNCLICLKNKLSSIEYSIWIRPLKAELSNNSLILYAPNNFVLSWVQDKYFSIIYEIINILSCNNVPSLKIKLGINQLKTNIVNDHSQITNINLQSYNLQHNWNKINILSHKISDYSNLNQKNNFSNFIEDKSNKFAKLIAYQISNYSISNYNLLFFYSDTGLGKTHLLHAIGNQIISYNNNKKIIYINSENFINDMIKAIQYNNIDIFRKYYCSVNILLLDDIQFFSGYKKYQEELFYIINFLLQKKQKVILTANCYLKKINGIENYLKYYFDNSLIIAIKSPNLKTRIIILMKKANEYNIQLKHNVAYFIAKKIIFNIHELKEILNYIIINSNFTDYNISIKFAKECLNNIFFYKKKLITIDNIQKIIIDYYKITKLDLISKCRSRSIVRPRQMAMAITKKLSSYSFSKIGDIFGRRDHKTVIHACRKINILRKENFKVKEDFYNLIKILSS